MTDAPLAHLPPIASLPSLPTSTRAEILDLLFEPCTQLHTLSVSLLSSTPPFSSYPALISAIGDQLTRLGRSSLAGDTAWLDAILSAHPRLGEKKVGSLSAQSQAEQAAMGTASARSGQTERDAEREAEMLRNLNAEYESTFPGLRYVSQIVDTVPPSSTSFLTLPFPAPLHQPDLLFRVFVNGRPRPTIMADMRARIARNDLAQEKADAIQAMCDIAEDRARKLGG